MKRRKKKMSATYYVFINGICTNPGDVSAWTDAAEVWVETHCMQSHATRLEYAADAIFRRMHQEERVDDLEAIVRRLAGRRIILVGHSNGCDIIERFIKRKNYVIDEIHLIAAASEADFEKNGINNAMKLGFVKSVHVYWSKKDSALQKAKWSSTLLSWIGLGYGYLGLVGPKKVNALVASRVRHTERSIDHSEWFSEGRFNETMRSVTGK